MNCYVLHFSKQQGLKFHFHYYLQQYFYEIVTDKGSFTLEMRNESNGYYGGSMEFIGEKPNE